MFQIKTWKLLLKEMFSQIILILLYNYSIRYDFCLKCLISLPIILNKSILALKTTIHNKLFHICIYAQLFFTSNEPVLPILYFQIPTFEHIIQHKLLRNIYLASISDKSIWFLFSKKKKICRYFLLRFRIKSH